MNDSKIVQGCYTLAITTFLSFFIFKVLLFFNVGIKIKSIIIALLSSAGIVSSIFYTKSPINIALMMSSIIGILYITFLYLGTITADLQFLIALVLLSIVSYSLYKIVKK